MMLLIYSVKDSKRLSYILSTVFKDIIGTEFTFTTSLKDFIAHKGPKLSYGEEPIGDEVFIHISKLLFEKGVNEQNLHVFEWQSLPAFFATHPKYEFPFDILAASFYLITRYEEYLPHVKDNHDRYVHTQSLAKTYGFLHKPLVNIWAEKIWQSLKAKYKGLKRKTPHFSFMATFDIDVAYAYRHRGLFRTMAGYGGSLLKKNFKALVERSRVLAGSIQDPYNTYGYQIETQKLYKYPSTYFFLVGDYGTYDKNINIEASPAMQSLIKGIADYAEVGLHPSYQSNAKSSQVHVEKLRIESVLHRKIARSRQHFLKLSLPNTYTNLISEGIEYDYSMGYADEIGFRASIATPYHFYDLDRDAVTPLYLVPFQVMDGTLKDYMRLSPEEAIKQTKKIIDETAKVNGLFVSIWHNQSLSERDGWQNWRPVYEWMMRYASQKANYYEGETT